MQFFITGTDTDIGKTYISTGLLRAFNQRGFSTLGIKPLASGGDYYNNQLQNADTKALQEAASIKLPYELLSPFTFKSPIAPHIAAQQENINLDLASLIQKCEPAFSYAADVKIIEGVGGWHVPLNNTHTMADFVIAQKIPVILVIGIKLGCLNHALLTHSAIQATGLPIVGWIANCIEPDMPCRKENILTLQQWLSSPCLGVAHFNGQPNHDIFLDKILNKIKAT